MAATKTTISENVTNDNATNGISIDAAGQATPKPFHNKITGNQGKGNGGFDGFDGNATCGSNTWDGNTFVTVNQPCVSKKAHVAPGPAPSPMPMPMP